MTCKNGGTCVPYSVNEPSCNMGQMGSTCCQCNWENEIILNEKKNVFGLFFSIGLPNYTGARCERGLTFNCLLIN